VEAKPAKVPKPAKAPKPVKEKKTAGEKKQKGKAGLFVLLGVLLVLIGGVAFAAFKMFPLSVEYDMQNSAATTTGAFDDIEISISANQPIASVYYALEPRDSENVEEYTQLKSNGVFSRTVTIPELRVPAGDSQLFIYTKTVFGQVSIESFKLKFDIGYTSAPEEEAIVVTEGGTKLISNELLITVANKTTEKQLIELIQSHGGKVVGKNNYMNQYQVRFEGSGEDYINDLKVELEQSGLIEEIYFNLVLDLDISATPNDKEYDSWDTEKPGGNNWGLECIDAPGAWEYNDEMGLVKIGVIDSVLDYAHEDLQINTARTFIQPSNDFTTLKALRDYFDRYKDGEMHQGLWHDCLFCRMISHGTHCTGIIGAVANNKKGVSGVSWNADMYFTTLWYYNETSPGMLEAQSTTAGLNHAISQMVMSGCRVVNMSFGSTSASAPGGVYEETAIASFNSNIARLEQDYDFLLIKAAGNDNADASNYQLNRIMTGGERSREHVIIVGSVSNSSSLTNRLAAFIGDLEKIYNMANYSNYGDLIDVCAPGTNIYNTYFGSEYDNMSGTSMAAPMVAGVASLVYGMDENLTFDIVKTIVCNTSKNFCSRNGEIYGVVNAKNAVEFASRFSGRLPELDKPSVGFLTGIVQDAKTLDLINGAVIVATDNETQAVAFTDTDEGFYDIPLASGTYTLEFSMDGYITETVYNVVIEEGVINYNILLNMVEDAEEIGSATGRIVDAFDASSIAQAQVKIYRGINQTAGETVAETTSNDSGQYTVSLPPGNYTAVVSANGYQSDFTNIIIIGGESADSQDCTLTPILQDGEVRVVLTWGEYPRDLDSHMVGPTPDGGRFHTYYTQKNYYYASENYVNLDVDDTSSYGPETTSIYVGVGGTYTFYVFDYTNRGSSTSNAMATSGAQVKVYIAGLPPVIYNVPHQDGTLWTVCSITNGQITPINTMSYETTSSNIGQ